MPMRSDAEQSPSHPFALEETGAQLPYFRHRRAFPTSVIAALRRGNLVVLAIGGSEIPATSRDHCKTPQPPPPPSGGLLLPWLLTGSHVCRRYLVNRNLSEQPGLCQSGSPHGGGDGKLSYAKVSDKRRYDRAASASSTPCECLLKCRFWLQAAAHRRRS